MNQNIYNLALVLHIVGIAITAGTTFIDFVTFKQFWKIVTVDNPKGALLEGMLHKLQRFMGIGMLLIIISGVLMMVYLHGVWGQQIWFQVKIGILILILINGLGIRRWVGSRLRKLLAAGPSANSFNAELSRLKGNAALIHTFQMVFFVIIFVLSVFKFN